MSKLVFLGGTVGNNGWREGFVKHFTDLGVDGNLFFNPVVADWNEEAQKNEERAKKEASHFLFYLADPKQDGNPLSAYSMVEATMALYDSPETTVVVFDSEGITGHALKAFNQAQKVLRKRFPNANIFSLEESLVWFKENVF